MSTHNICFYGELPKIILQLSSNTLLFCSSGPKLEHDRFPKSSIINTGINVCKAARLNGLFMKFNIDI